MDPVLKAESDFNEAIGQADPGRKLIAWIHGRPGTTNGIGLKFVDESDRATMLQAIKEVRRLLDLYETRGTPENPA